MSLPVLPERAHVPMLPSCSPRKKLAQSLRTRDPELGSAPSQLRSSLKSSAKLAWPVADAIFLSGLSTTCKASCHCNMARTIHDVSQDIMYDELA